MRKSILLVLFIVSNCLFGHSQTEESQIKMFYESAIKNHIDNFQQMFENGSSAVKIEDLYFISKDIPEVYLPKKIGQYNIKYIDVYNKKSKRLLRKGVFAVSIQPLILKNEQAIINLIDFTVTYKNRNYDFSNGGGSKTSFEYSCTGQSWEILNTEFFGI